MILSYLLWLCTVFGCGCGCFDVYYFQLVIFYSRLFTVVFHCRICAVKINSTCIFTVLFHLVHVWISTVFSTVLRIHCCARWYTFSILFTLTVQSYVKVYAIRLFLEKVYQISILFKSTSVYFPILIVLQFIITGCTQWKVYIFEQPLVYFSDTYWLISSTINYLEGPTLIT